MTTPIPTILLGYDTTMDSNAYGVRTALFTALFTAHGFYRGLDYAHYIKDSGIVPDYILPQL